MIKQTLAINGIDFSSVATSITYGKEVTYDSVITTLDGKEHGIGRRVRPVLNIEMMLRPGQQSAEWAAISAEEIYVTYDDPDVGTVTRRLFRLSCNLDKAFQVRNSDGDWFSMGTVVLRSVEVI